MADQTVTAAWNVEDNTSDALAQIAEQARATAEAEAAAAAQREDAERAAAQAARERAEAQAQAEREAAESAERAARAADTALQRQARAIAGLSAEDVKLAAAYRKSRDELEAKARVLGLSVGEYARLTAATKANADATRTAGAAATKGAEGFQHLGQQGGDAESALRALGGVVGLVNPELSSMISVVAEVGGGIEGLAKGGGLLSNVFGSVGMAAGVLGVALAAGVAAWGAYTLATDSADRATRRATQAFTDQVRQVERATAAINANMSALQSAAAAAQDAELQAAVIRGEVSAESAQAQRATTAIESQRAPTAEGMAQLVSGLEGQLRELDRALATGNRDVVERLQAEGKSRAGLEQQLAIARESLADFEGETQRQVTVVADLAFAQLEARTAAEQKAAADKAAAEAARRRAEADRAAEEQARALAQAEAQAAAAAAALEQQQAAAYAAMQADASAILQLSTAAEQLKESILAADPALTAEEAARRKLAQELTAQAAEIGRLQLAGAFDADQAQQLLDVLEAQRQAFEASVQQQEQQARGGGTGASVIQGALTGSLSAALAPVLSALGPQGAVAGAVISLLEQGPEQVEAIALAIPEALGSIVDSVASLPELAPELIEKLIKELPGVLITLLLQQSGILAIQLVTALIGEFPALLDSSLQAVLTLITDLPALLFDVIELPRVLAEFALELPFVLVEAFRLILPELKTALRDALRDSVNGIIREIRALFRSVNPFGQQEGARLAGRIGELLRIDVKLDGRLVGKGLSMARSKLRGGADG